MQTAAPLLHTLERSAKYKILLSESINTLSFQFYYKTVLILEASKFSNNTMPTPRLPVPIIEDFSPLKTAEVMTQSPLSLGSDFTLIPLLEAALKNLRKHMLFQIL